MRSTLLAANLGSTWSLLDDHGYKPEGFFQSAGIDPDQLGRPEARVDLNRAMVLWQRVNNLFNDPCLGLKFQRYWHPSQLHALGYAWISSKTIREALSRLVRYSKILTEGVTYHIREEQPEVTVEMEFMFEHSADIGRLLGTAATATLVHMCRLNYRKELNPLKATFKHREPTCAGEYFAFFKTNVTFGADRYSVTFSSAAMDRALVGHDPQMVTYADQVAVQHLANLDNSDISHRAKAKIVEMMPSGNVKAKTVAKALYLSDRSLSRRLNEAGTSFRKLLEETRREMVTDYLKDSNVDLREMPYLLGYKNYSSFFKAFKRWTGQAPSELSA